MSDVYQKKIINYLLDRYERSKLFSGENKVNVRIKEKTVKIFPEYGEHSAFEKFMEINMNIQRLIIYKRIQRYVSFVRNMVNFGKRQIAI